MPIAVHRSALDDLNWVIYHVIEHEAHQRGQIFLLMRLQGVTPPEL